MGHIILKSQKTKVCSGVHSWWGQYLRSFIHHITGLFGANIIGRVLHRYRRGHGFKSRIGLIFFRPYLHYCLGSVLYCKDRFHSSVRFTSIYSPLKLAVRPFLPAIIYRFHIKPLVVLLNQRSWNYFNFFSLLHCQFAWLVLILHMRVLRKFVTMVVGDLSAIGTGD